MAFSNDDALFFKGMDLYKRKDPMCIKLFKECNDSRSRARLAMIYFKGFLKIKKDYERALSYCENNNHYLAVSIECEIRVFKRKETEYYPIAFSKLSIACTRFQNNERMNELLSRMFLQGLGTKPNYLEACRFQPKLKNRDYFKSQAKYCSDGVKKELLSQFETMTSEAPEYYCFMGDLHGLMHANDSGHDCYLKAIDAGIHAYNSVIAYLLKSNKPSEALEYARKWYAVDRCPASADALATVSIELKRPYSSYIGILDEFKNDPACLRKELHEAYINNMDEHYKELISYAIKHDVPAYDTVARYYLSIANSDEAIRYF